MTCIAGLVENGCVWMGSDSAGVAHYDLVIRADEKVFKNDEFLFGFTSSFRMGQALRFDFKPPDRPENVEPFRYMVSTFIPEVRKCLKAAGFLKKENEVEKGGTFLVGFRGELFCVESDFQVGRPVDNFAAVGCGGQIAHGAMAAMRDFSIKPHEKVLRALRAAERYSAGVRGPFKILSITTRAKKKKGKA